MSLKAGILNAVPLINVRRVSDKVSVFMYIRDDEFLVSK